MGNSDLFKAFRSKAVANLKCIYIKLPPNIRTMLKADWYGPDFRYVGYPAKSNIRFLRISGRIQNLISGKIQNLMSGQILNLMSGQILNLMSGQILNLMLDRIQNFLSGKIRNMTSDDIQVFLPGGFYILFLYHDF